ncbi:thioredoxin domain-containing protein [Mycobacterium sp. CBMA247]|nr:thioredoxin domain-containing protein [Mycolicibacterium sp. CBMA 329]MUL87388.1 thioredoxin domain-containing protein [Mycolicibacterium sp. CBMA 331]MUL99746.1 thioredoxin domain-containing protein [Mycolicibacterium sp. CBMA 334]MUM25344.1 thioredoxin domain-containing protein [Mycolicibacterium sp. CBMA 295]MUM37685.1 thioredoxin domain-containing protein [Mycolicibacterium sp. CBMA 247]MUM43453.1 thioredoxin domain-containing protein [Mycolicibacterium sp. CBMA 294]
MLAVLALSTAGCTRLVDGTAQANGNQPGSEITEDGWGIQVGYPDAPAQIEFFTEPQCPACAHLQHEAGDAIAAAVGQGRLAVTYRPLTFLDGSVTDYSARVANALFLAAGPNTTGTAFQAFVEDLWGHQDAEGSPGPTDDAIAAMASESGVGAEQTDKIAAGAQAVDSEQLNDANSDLLGETADSVATPTIYDLVGEKVVDTSDPEWLAKLLATPTS